MNHPPFRLRGIRLACVAAAVFMQTPCRAETLGDAIALAYQTNPALLAARADLRALDERYIQARAALGPSARITEQHAYAAAAIDQPASFFTPKRTTYGQGQSDTAQVTLGQPLYASGQMSASIAAAEAEVLGGRQALRQQEQVVLNQVITAYSDVVLAQELVTIADQNVEILLHQLEETQAKVDVKQNTLTDRAQARARLSAAKLSAVQARGSLADATSRYLDAVGQPPGQLDLPPDLPGVPPTIDAAFDAAERANPQLQAAVFAEMASRAEVAEARAADGLQISLSGSVSTQPEYIYAPNLNERSAAIAVVVSKPLFTAGANRSRIRQARETNDRDELKISATRRDTIAAVSQAWNDLSVRRRQVMSLNDQITDEQVAFQGSQIEERIGLRTTIDVLNAEQEFQSTKVALAQAYHDEYLNRAALLASVGLLQAELLEPDIHPYHPEETFNRRNALNRALAWEGLVAMIDSLGGVRVDSEPDRAPLGEARPAHAVEMPQSPHWSDLAARLKDDPTGG